MSRGPSPGQPFPPAGEHGGSGLNPGNINALTASDPLAVSYRLDAEHNETCFKDEDGNKIDLDEANDLGLNLDFDLDLDQPQNLLVNPLDGSITAAAENSTMATVCQYNGTANPNILQVSNFTKSIRIIETIEKNVHINIPSCTVP